MSAFYVVCNSNFKLQNYLLMETLRIIFITGMVFSFFGLAIAFLLYMKSVGYKHQRTGTYYTKDNRYKSGLRGQYRELSHSDILENQKKSAELVEQAGKIAKYSLFTFIISFIMGVITSGIINLMA